MTGTFCTVIFLGFGSNQILVLSGLLSPYGHCCLGIHSTVVRLISTAIIYKLESEENYSSLIAPKLFVSRG